MVTATGSILHHVNGDCEFMAQKSQVDTCRVEAFLIDTISDEQVMDYLGWMLYTMVPKGKA